MEKEKEGKKIISIDLDDDDDEEVEDEDTNHSHSENTNQLSENGSSNSGTKRNKKMTKAVIDVLNSSNAKFLSNFDPELSNRERRKLTRKLNSEGKKNGSVHDDNAVLEKDVCDCLKEECPGCHFPCPKCRSCKCGLECRVSRKWSYEEIENETGSGIT